MYYFSLNSVNVSVSKLKNYRESLSGDKNVTKHEVVNLSVCLLRGVGLGGALIGRGHDGGDGGGCVQLIAD